MKGLWMGGSTGEVRVEGKSGMSIERSSIRAVAGTDGSSGMIMIRIGSEVGPLIPRAVLALLSWCYAWAEDKAHSRARAGRIKAGTRDGRKSETIATEDRIGMNI